MQADRNLSPAETAMILGVSVKALIWSALVEQFTQGDPKLAEGARKVWADAMADPVIASKYQPQLPVSPELFAFVSKAMAVAKSGK